ncbi:aarF domain-containing kinase 1 [Schistocerca piceifrons]|uniref:aarF domain-containing kinase 1 n=1 Tax=Schistocerca piceifrons TaxID=274613 RepID=UPI001F5EF1E1|nr:aarF domain-containing kinase 1 [Schistocerca piceifrons]
MLKFGTLIKYGLLGSATVGAVASWKANQYDISSIGIVRFGRAASTVLRIAALYKRTLYATGLDTTGKEYEMLSSEVHRKAAEMLLELCKANRGVYIKVGQHIGALDYIVPPEYVETLKVLHSRAPCSDLHEVMTVLKEDLKREPLDIFKSIEDEPIGTASLAQVHKAVLRDGSRVAVKVQHPSVLGNSVVDIRTMELLVSFISWAFPDFKFEWLVSETKRNLPLELDFANEGKNAEKVASMFNKLTWLKIPKIHWPLTTRRVLTMEYVDGKQVNDIIYIKDSKIDPFEVSDKLSYLYAQMIFVEGFVHSDPHPGNIFLTKTGKKLRITLLDHGLYATLSPEFCLEYAKLWLAILNVDMKGIKQQCEVLGVKEMYGLCVCMVTGRTWESIQSGLEKKNYTKSEKEKFQEEIPKWLPQITEVLGKVNREMLLIFKSNDLLRGIEHTLGTESRRGSLFMMWRCCINRVYTDKLNKCSSRVKKLHIKLCRQWQFFKLNLYYGYLRILAMPYLSSVLRLFGSY